ncbi:MAG: hydrogenase expression/formation protein HypE [Trueperaceae bacterium]|nr:hydrogenase expression/formation protein HypE [Trueperaceae bacterium]
MMIKFHETHIEMAHGAGGKASRRLVEGLIAPHLMPETLLLEDAASLAFSGQLVFTSDSFVVKPLRFPGGSIGDLAVNGTVNDLAVSGAEPLALMISLIIEEGLESVVLEHELRAMAQAASKAGVKILGGDTKVVEHGKADGLYISSAGIGRYQENLKLSMERVAPGDKIILSGPIGNHGITILLARGELDLSANLVSDTRSVWPFVKVLAETVPQGLKWMRDPTRGGVASVLNELARDSALGIELEEERIPVHPAVRGACEILGLDPLHIANEGQFLAVVSALEADKALAGLQALAGTEEAQMIGQITEAHSKTVVAKTLYGGARVVDMLVGDPLPRIC